MRYQNKATSMNRVAACIRRGISQLLFVPLLCGVSWAAPGDVFYNGGAAQFAPDGSQGPAIFPATTGNVVHFEMIDALGLNGGNALDLISSMGTAGAELFFAFEPIVFQSYLDFSNLIPPNPPGSYTSRIEKFNTGNQDHFYEIRRNDADRMFMFINNSFVNASSLVPSVSAPAVTQDVAIADFDRVSADPEIVRATSTGDIEYLVYDSAASAFVSVPGVIPGIGTQPSLAIELLAADFDLNGQVDVFVGGVLQSFAPRLFLNQGGGSFTDASNLLPNFPKDCINPKAVDLNGNVFPEIYCGTVPGVPGVIGNPPSVQVRDFIIRNDFGTQPSLGFSIVSLTDPNPMPPNLRIDVNAIDVDFADVDCDGDTDIVGVAALASLRFSNPVTNAFVMKQTANPLEFEIFNVFTSTFSPPVRPHVIRFADFSRDGKPDLIVGTGNEFVPGNTAGQFDAFINNDCP